MGFILGIDGGGTSAKAVILREGEEQGRALAGGINYNSYSTEQIQNHLSELAGQCRALGFEPASCEGVGVGAAGVSNPKAAPFLKQALQNCGFSCSISIAGDHVAALKGGLLDEAGVLLISGTGSVCLAQNSKAESCRAGGYGHLIDDEGSAYAIGRDILSAVVRAHDHRAEQTRLTEAVFERIGISSVEEMVSFVYGKETGKKEIARLALLLTEEMILTDCAAEKIAKRAAVQLLELAEPAVRWLEKNTKKAPYPLLLAGSVLENNQRIRGFLEQLIEEKEIPLYVAERKKDAAYGATLLI